MIRTPQLIASLPPYVPGKPIEAVAREFGLSIESISKLASNENPLGAPRAAKEAAMSSIEKTHLYPDNDSGDLKAALAEKFQMPIDSIVIGTGSVEIIECVANAFLDRDDTAMYSQYGFAIYKIAILASNHRYIEVPATPDLGHDLDGFLSHLDETVKVIYIANPNNPTGTMISECELDRFIDKIPENIVVVIDEAYHEFVSRPDYPNGLKYLKQGRKNILVLRTFSKIYGLAALRIGYGFASKEICTGIEKVRTYFNVSLPAQDAAVAALKCDDHVRASVAHIESERAFVTEKLTQMGVKWLPCEGNFLLIDLGCPTGQLFRELQRQGIIIRPVDNYGLPNHFRLSYGLRSDNEKFLRRMANFLGK